MKKSSLDLTQGNIVKQILIFAVPILLSQIFQNLYNSIDSIVVGRCVGMTALAAVTASGDISHLLIGFFTGLSAGSGVLFSRYFGSKQYDKLHDAIHTALLVAVIAGLVLTVVGISATPVLLELAKCPEDVFEESILYLRIYLIGVLFTSVYNLAAGVLRSVGDSKNPFWYLVIASLTNIVLDIVFVVFFKMGVAGVAIATVIAQLSSVILVFAKMLHTDDVYRVVLRDLKIDRGMLLEVLRLGLPAAVQSSLIAVSNLFVQRYINGFGAAALAGSGAAKKLDQYVGMLSQSLGLAITTFVSQNVGAGLYERAFKGIRNVMIMGFVVIAVLGIPVNYFAEFLLRMFTTDEEALKYGAMMLHIMMPLYYFQTLHQIFSNTVRGFGKSTVTMLTSILGLICCRQLYLALAMLIRYEVGNVFFAHPFGWVCSALFAMTYYWFAIRRPYNQAQRRAGKR